MVNTEQSLQNPEWQINYNILNIVVNTELAGIGSIISGDYNILNIVVNTEP